MTHLPHNNLSVINGDRKSVYDPPKTNPLFVEKWNSFIKELKERDSFTPSHLHYLEILCDLYVEYDHWLEDIRQNGTMYVSEGRNGHQEKPRMAVTQKNKVVEHINTYTKLLELNPKKAGSGAGGIKPRDDKEDWS